MTISDRANGRWPDLLAELAGLTAEQLTDRHQPCPCCGGTDRYRFDDRDGTGSWFCNQCGGKDGAGGGGTGIDLLMRVTGWSYADACRRIESHLGVIPDPPTAGAEYVWPYGSGFLVCRFPGKKIRPLWWDGESWRWKAPPDPRPLYRLDALRQRPDAPVLIVEGEKTADAAQRLFPSAVAITWPSGCKAIAKADWSPLAGRRCVLWPDADDAGRDAMAKLAPRLMAAGAAQVRIVHPPADVPAGWDLADADWTPQQASDYLKSNRTPPIESARTAESEPQQAPVRPLVQSAPFTCLGFDGDGFFYQPGSTGQVIRLGRSAHTSTNLCALAELAYWESLYPGGRTGANWTAAASSLFAMQASVGVYSPDRIRGRGAWWDGRRSVLHLGDQLIIDGAPAPVSDGVPGSSYVYQRLSRLHGPSGADPLDDESAFQILDLANRFLWEVPASGLLLAGWATLAPICGALDWRPHIWLTAGSGSGKTEVLGRFIAPLIGDMGLIVAGNTTEPGIRQALRADALPVIFDEAESNERNDQQRMQAVLGLARVASSESRAHTLKGSPEGETQRYTVRSMFMMSSIATALKQGADKSRFAQLTLRNPNELPKDQRAQHWALLERDLDAFVSDAIGQRLQARTISLIPVIRQSVRVFTRAAADAFGSQRLGDQYGTLLAGAWSLTSREVATAKDADDLISANDWTSYSQSVEVPDEQRCLERILQHQLRVEADRVVTRTVGELADLAQHYTADRLVTPNEAQAVLGRHGLKAEGGELIVSNTANAVAAILRDTAWVNCWPTVLARLPGARKTGAVRFAGAGAVSRAVALQIRPS